MSIWTIIALFWGVICAGAIGLVMGANQKKKEWNLDHTNS